MRLDLHDPRCIAALIAALALGTCIAIPSYVMEVLLTVAFSAILAPGLDWLRRTLRLSIGLTVALVAFVIIALLGVGGYYGIPLFVRGINETLAQVPDSIHKMLPFLKDWLAQVKVRLEGLIPGEGGIEELIRKKLPELAGGTGGDALKLALTTVFGSAVAIGHFLLFLVLTAILLGEWDKNTERANWLVELLAPTQQRALASFGAKFQSYGVDLFCGIGIVMLIFMPIFFALLYFYGGLPLGKSMLFGVILGATSAIPTIGGIITYLILVVVGILNFGLEPAGLKTTFVMYVFAFVVHLAETKFVTPRVLGHRISFTSFAVITVLVGSVLALGITRGILAGLFLLVALKALVEVAAEGRAMRPAKADSAQDAASPAANVAATVMPTEPGPAAVAARGGPLSMGHRKGRGRR